MRNSVSNSESSDDDWTLMEEKPAALSSQCSGGTVKQHRESGPSTSTQYQQLQEERIEVRMDHKGYTLSVEIYNRWKELCYYKDQNYFLKCRDTYVCVGGRSVAADNYTKASVVARRRKVTKQRVR